MINCVLKVKLYKTIKLLLIDKLPIFEEGLQELIAYCHKEGEVSEEEILSQYSNVHSNYADAISEVLIKGMPVGTSVILLMTMQSPSLVGFPNNITFKNLSENFYAAYYFAFYFHVMTRKKIKYSDYTKYIKPLIRFEDDLINTALQKLVMSK